MPIPRTRTPPESGKPEGALAARPRSTALVVLLACLVAWFGGPARADDARLLDALRGGGHVLYVRHARADLGEDAEVDDLTDCSRQRNLSATGREQAARLGEAIRQLGVPVGAVLASPFCRTLDTARLAFGWAEVADDLRGGGPLAERDRPRIVAALRGRLAAAPRAGTNTVLVAHGNNMRWLEGFQLGDAEAAVFRPEGEGYRFVARVRLERWPGPAPR